MIERFSLVQYVTAPTHEHGHMLDFVSSHGFTWCGLVLSDTYISDHLSIVFSVRLPHPTTRHMSL